MHEKRILECERAEIGRRRPMRATRRYEVTGTVPVVSLESNLTWKATKVLKFHFFWNRKFELTFSAKFNLYNTPVKVIK